MEVEFFARYPQYIQLVGVGLVWISLHCAGMCGPIVLGLDLGANLSRDKKGTDKEESKLGGFLHSFIHITLYQSGRSVTYAIMGALAGLGGAGLQSLFKEITKATGLLVAAALFLFGIVRLAGTESLLSFSSSSSTGRWLGKMARWGKSISGFRGKFVLGIILGLLPCMITFWALGLAASTQSPVHGAAIMVLLVWMTSFVIYGFGMAPALTPSRYSAIRERLLSVFLVFSGVWLGIVSAAANEWIAHWSISFSFRGSGYTIMFW